MKFFMITPYTLDKLYERKKREVQKIAKKMGLHAYYASDYMFDGEFNIDKSLELFKEVDFFIADLSFERPSCYFEVGYAQSLNKKVYIISRENTMIHQVLYEDKIETYTDMTSYYNLLNSIIERAVICSESQLLKIGL